MTPNPSRKSGVASRESVGAFGVSESRVRARSHRLQTPDSDSRLQRLAAAADRFTEHRLRRSGFIASTITWCGRTPQSCPAPMPAWCASRRLGEPWRWPSMATVATVPLIRAKARNSWLPKSRATWSVWARSPIAVTNCLNFASPERPEVMWSFSEVIDGMAEACQRA